MLFRSSNFRSLLERDGVPDDVEVRIQQEFPRWFKEHVSLLLHFSLSLYIYSISLHDFSCGTPMMCKAREESEDLDQELFALACGPHSKVHTLSVCAVNCVRFVTADREKGKKTQNSRVMTDGDHEGVERAFYGV